MNNKEGPGKVPKDDVVKHGIALREFHGPQSKAGNATLRAVFQVPHVEFLCNHELVLYLEIEEGHYETSTSTLDVAKVTLAMCFSLHVQDLSVTLNGGNCLISILAVDAVSAQLVYEKSHVASNNSCQGQKPNFDALFLLIKTHYLPTLSISGLLNLFVLPPSYTGKQVIDHAILAKSIQSCGVLFSVELEKINEILGHHWLSAVNYCDVQMAPSSDTRVTYLAEYQTSWPLADGQLCANYKFNPLRIQVLCEKEVILFINADISLYYDQEEKELDSEFRDWEVAIIFQVVSRDGCTFLDRSHTPRIAPNLSSFPCLQPDDCLEEFQYHFKDTILRDYVELIFKFGHHQLFPDSAPQDTSLCSCGGPHSHTHPCPSSSHPTKSGSIPGPKPEPINWPTKRPDYPRGPYCPGGSEFMIDWALLWELFINETSLHGYHQVTSVTQAGINAHFTSIWKKAKSIIAAPSPDQKDIDKRLSVLVHFDSKDGTDGGSAAYLPQFAADFGAPQIKLVIAPGSKSVILYFNIQKISFTLDKIVHDFKNWVLAFKFDLKLLSIPVSTNATDGSGLAGLRQLILDSKSVTFVHDQSSFAGLVNTKEPDVTRALYGTLARNMIERYIKAFVEAQHHVLYTLPVHSHERIKNKPDTHARAHAVTDVAFSIVPFSLSTFKGRTFQGLWGPSRHIVERNMIVFHGVVGDSCSPDRPPGLLPGPYGAPSIQPPHGTLLLAREVFLETYILKPLAEVNTLSTILSKFNGVDKSHWDLTLETWVDGRMKVDPGDICQWEAVSVDEACDGGKLHYRWLNSEEWKYEAEGKGVRVGRYTVTAKTNNRLTIPTLTTSGPLIISLEGSCIVRLEYGIHETKHWSGTLEATWEAPITLVSDEEKGLSTKAPKQVTVAFKKESLSHTAHAYDPGQTALDSVDTRFRDAFGTPIDISTLVECLNKSFSGVYQGLVLSHTELVLAKPIFNANGDLLVQILPKNAAWESTGEKNTAAQIGTPATSGNPPGESIQKRKEARRAKAAPVAITTAAVTVSRSSPSPVPSVAPLPIIKTTASNRDGSSPKSASSSPQHSSRSSSPATPTSETVFTSTPSNQPTTSSSMSVSSLKSQDGYFGVPVPAV